MMHNYSDSDMMINLNGTIMRCDFEPVHRTFVSKSKNPRNPSLSNGADFYETPNFSGAQIRTRFGHTVSENASPHDLLF
jgi:hypothetical protein